LVEFFEKEKIRCRIAFENYSEFVLHFYKKNIEFWGIDNFLIFMNEIPMVINDAIDLEIYSKETRVYFDFFFDVKFKIYTQLKKSLSHKVAQRTAMLTDFLVDRDIYLNNIVEFDNFIETFSTKIVLTYDNIMSSVGNIELFYNSLSIFQFHFKIKMVQN
jgi:hypothetical protein